MTATILVITHLAALGGGWWLCSRYGTAAKTLAAQVEQSAGSIAQAAEKL